MSGNVDERIVSMQLKNESLVAGARTSKKALDDINRSVDQLGRNKGVNSLGQQVGGIGAKFSALQVAAVTAIGTITNRMVNAGLTMAKSMTIDPIMDGFREYEKLLTSTQTIMANTGASAKVVGGYLGDLNTYADQTVYNFGQMADSIGKFTAAGVKLESAVPAIKGMANSAALFGSDANQLNTAMYQMSQALATGTIRLMDWNSLANAGMGGANMRNSLIATAKAVGTSQDLVTKATKDFRGSLADGWLSAEIFEKTMKVMAGQTMPETREQAEKLGLNWDKLTKSGKKAGDTVAYSVEQLMKMGYAKDAAKELAGLSARAIESATKIKTFTQMIDVIKESIGSGWAKIFGSLFGNIKQAGKLWTTVGNAITGTIDTIFDGISGMLETWNKAGGYKAVWAGFGNIFKALGNIIRPVVGLFTSMLPGSKSAGNSLVTLSKGFEKVTSWIEKATRGVASITPVFRFMGGIIRTVIGIFTVAIGKFAEFLGILGGKTVDAVRNLVDYLQNLYERIDSVANVTDRLAFIRDAFVALGNALRGNVLTAVSKLGAALLALFSGDFTGFKNLFVDAFKSLTDVETEVYNVFGNIRNLVESLRKHTSGIFDPILAGASRVMGYLGGLGATIKGLFSRGSSGDSGASESLDILAASAGKADSATDSVKSGLESMLDVLSNVWGKIKAVVGAIAGAVGSFFGKITGAVGGMDRVDWGNVINIGMLGAIYMMVRRFIDSFDRLIPDLKGIGDSMVGSFNQLTDTLKTMQQSVQATIIRNIAIGVALLAASLILLSLIPAKKLGKGLGFLSALIGLLVAAMYGLSKVDGGFSITTVAASLTLMATAMIMLAAAVGLFGNMELDVLKQGMLGIGLAITTMVIAAQLISGVSGQLVGASVSIVAFAIAANLLIGAIFAFGNMDTDVLVKGVGAITGTLVALAVSMLIFAKTAGAMLIVSVALGLLSITLTMFLATIMAYAAVSFDTIFDGVSKIATALLILGAASLVAAPPLVVLGVAMALIGAGMLAIGTGMALLGVGVATLAATGTASVAVVTAAISAFIGLLPMIAMQLASAFVSILETLAAAMPRIRVALDKILTEVIKFLIDFAPKLIPLISKLIDVILKVLLENVPKIVLAGYNLLLALLKGIRDNIPKIATVIMEILVALIEGLGTIASGLVTAIFEFILDVLDLMEQAVSKYIPQFMSAGGRIAKALFEGILKGLVPDGLVNGIRDVGTNMINAFKQRFGINSPSKVFLGIGKDIFRGLINGIVGMIGNILKTIRNIATKLIAAFINIVSSLPKKAVNALKGLAGALGGVISGAFGRARSIVSNGISNLVGVISGAPGKIMSLAGKFASAGSTLLGKLVSGMTNGVKSVGGIVTGALSSITSGIKSFINDNVIRRLNNALTFRINLPGPKDINFSAKIPYLAKGTDNFGGGMAMVGEQGQELVVMPKGARVLTNKNTRNVSTAIETLRKMGAGGQKIELSVRVDIPEIKVATVKSKTQSKQSPVLDKIAAMVQSIAKNSGNISLTGSEATRHAGSIKTVGAAGNKIYGSQASVIAGTISADAIRLDALKAKQAAYENAAKDESKDAAELEKEAKKLRKQANKVKGDGKAAKAKRAALEAKAREKEKQAERRKNKSSNYEKQADLAADAAEKLKAKQDAAKAAADRKAAYDKLVKDGDFQGAAEMDAEDAASAAKASQAQRKRALELRAQADIQAKSDKAEAARLRKEAEAAAKKGDKAKARRLRKQAQDLLKESAKDQAALNAQATKAELDAAKSAARARQEADNSVANQQKANAKAREALEYELAYDAMSAQEKAAADKKRSDEKLAESNKAYELARAKLAEANNAKDAKTKAKLIIEGQEQLDLARELKKESEEYLNNMNSGSSAAGNALGMTAEDIQAINDALKAPEIDISSNRVQGAQTMFDAYSKSLAATIAAVQSQVESPQPIQYVQNNYSPKALSSVDIYRQSKSLIATQT